MTTRKPIDEFLALSPAQRKLATSEFDKPFAADSFKKLTPRQKTRWTAAKRKRGRPVVGQGSKRVSVTIERSLLKEVDRLAKQQSVTRAELIARGLRTVLSPKGSRAA